MRLSFSGVTLFVLGGVPVFVMLFTLIWHMTTTVTVTREVTNLDKLILISPDELAEFYELPNVDKKQLRYQKKLNLATLEHLSITFFYDQSTFVSSELFDFQDEERASTQLLDYQDKIISTLKSQGVDVSYVESPLPFEIDNEYRFFTLSGAEGKFADVFVMKSKSKIWQFFIIGFELDEEVLETLIKPRIPLLAKYN